MKKKTKKEFNFKGAKRVGNKFKNSDLKVIITVRIDPPVLLWLRREAGRIGIGYQTLLNALLRLHMETNAPRHELGML